jgi:hypothetical protein
LGICQGKTSRPCTTNKVWRSYNLSIDNTI